LRRSALLAAAALVAAGPAAQAFCGFYVATADEPLTNKASRVVLVHDGARTIVTMASDVHGDPKQFALVIPVPTVIQRDQVRIVKPETVEHLADYTKPRLVEYYDQNPCHPYPPPMPAPMAAMAPPAGAIMRSRVTVEAAFSVAEYDIMVLSADDSSGLIDWLNRNGYRMPQDAAPVVGSYIGQGMHFFVAKVNLDRMRDNPSGFLRPIRVTYATPKFMLPIRLGTVNAAGPQDMIVLALTRTGRVDVTNYQTRRMPTGIDIPEYVADRFGSFYGAAFDHQVQETGGKAVFLEYAWPVVAGNAALCDPCSAPPLSPDVFDEIGVPWDSSRPSFITRLHVRYDRDHFPEDLQFQETPDTEQYQARYVVNRHIVKQSELRCAKGTEYSFHALPDQWAKERDNLVRLTGWPREQVHTDMVAQWNKARAE
jgi:hypothetical protein